MSGVIDTLECDLKSLASEAGRSLPAVKEAAAIAISRLSSLRSQYEAVARQAAEGLQCDMKLEDVFRPFLLACNHKNAGVKLVVVALGSLQKLLHADVLDSEERMHVMHVLVLQSQREKPSKEIDVKILQTLPLLLTPRLHAVKEELLFDGIGLCCNFYFHDPGLASAALTQIVTGLFDRIEVDVVRNEDDMATHELDNAQINHCTALRLLDELTMLIAQNSAATASSSGSNASSSSINKSAGLNGNSTSAPSSTGRLSPFFRGVSSSSLSSTSSGSSTHSFSSGDAKLLGPSYVASTQVKHAIRHMPRSLALELLENILSSHASVFVLPQTSESFGRFVQTRVCPVLVRSFRGKCDWRLMVRMMRTVVVMLCELRSILLPEDVQTLLGQLLHMLDDESSASESGIRYVTPLWHRVLTLETLNILCSNQDLLGEFQHKYMRAEPMRSVSAFVQIVEALCGLVSRVVQQPQVAAGIDEIAARPTKGLDLLSEEEPPQNLNESLVALLAAECLASIADSMALSQGLMSPQKDTKFAPVVQIGRVHSRSELSPPPLLKKQSSMTTAPEDALMDPMAERQDRSRSNSGASIGSTPGIVRENTVRREVVREMMENCWKPMLQALALLLEHCNNENIVQFILKAYMSMTNTCGILGLVDARNAYIMSLCTFSLPNWHSSAAILPQQYSHTPGAGGNELQAKHLQALKALFNIAHGLGSILGNAWHIVLETFEQLDHIMFRVAIEKKLTTAGNVHVTGLGPSMNAPKSNDAASDWHLVDDEMAIVESMLRFLFKSTKYLDDDALIDMQTALTQLSFTVLAHTETMRTLSRQEASSSSITDFVHASSFTSSSSVSSTPYSPPPPPTPSKGESTPPPLLHLGTGSSPSPTPPLSPQRRTNASSERKKKPSSGKGEGWSSMFNLNALAEAVSSVTSYDLDDDSDDDYDEEIDFERQNASTASYGTENSMRSNSFTVQRGNPTWSSSSRRQTEPISSPSGGFDSVLDRATFRSPPFAIEKLVETTRLNTFRIGLLWEMTQNVLSTVASKSDPRLRLYGVQSLEELVTTALLYEESTEENGRMEPPAPVTASPIASEKPVKWKSRRAKKSAAPKEMQKELAKGFLHLFKSHHFDAREAAVQSLHRIVGTCGHVLTDGWSLVIQELSIMTGTVDVSNLPEPLCVPEYTPKEISKLVPMAFKVVQLIVDDFLPSLDADRIRDLARCIRAFGDQEPHVNISLTSVTMLWNMCDHIQKTCTDVRRFNRTPTVEEEQQVENCNILLLYVFEQLNHLALDQRPEVRNCAIRTLCSIIVACAPKLTMDSWRICNMGILFPLLDEIITRGSKAPTDQVHGEILGASGERTRVHHSLDTLEKQWRETIVTTIQGATRVVRATIQYAGHMEWSIKTWEIMLDTIRSTLFRKPQNKVGLAATRALQDLAALVTGGSKARFAAVGMQVVNGALVRVDSATPASPVSPVIAESEGVQIAKGTPIQKLWELVLGVYENITAYSNSFEDGDGTTIILEGVASGEIAADICSGIGELYSSSTANQLLRVHERICKWMELIRRLLEAFPANSKHITNLERSVLTTYESFPPIPDASWPLLLNELHGYAKGVLVKGCSKGFSDKSQSLFVSLFERHAPSGARALAFEETIAGLCATLDAEWYGGELKKHENGMSGWDINALLPVFKYGLRSLSHCGWLSSRVEDVWMNLLHVLDLILERVQKDVSSSTPAQGAGHGEGTNNEATGTSGVKRLDLSLEDGLVLLNIVLEEVRPLVLTNCIPAGVQDSLFDLLHRGCAVSTEEQNDLVTDDTQETTDSAPEQQSRSFVISRACLEHLVTLSAVSTSDSDHVTERVLTTLQSGVEQLVDRYMNKHRRTEADDTDLVALLERLCDLELKTVPKACLSRFNGDVAKVAGAKAHIVLLFPILNRLVGAESSVVRASLQKLFEEMAHVFVIRPPSDAS